MKTFLLTITVLFLTITVKSQTVISNDSINIYLFDMINEYRQEKGLKALKLDTGLVNACRHHSKYLMYMEERALDTYGHAEYKEEVPGQECIPYMRDRAIKYCPTMGSSISECVMISDYNTNFAVNYYYLNGDTTYRDGRVKFIESINSGTYDYKSLAKYIISAWINSPSHNEGLLEGYKAGVYVYFYKTLAGTYISSATYLVTDDVWEQLMGY